VDDLTHLPKRDLKAQQWATCALVGQAAGLRAAGVGAAVDAHEAVWRFNLQAPTANTSRWVGKRTTVRMLNHPASHLAYDVEFNELSEDEWGEDHQVRRKSSKAHRKELDRNSKRHNARRISTFRASATSRLTTRLPHAHGACGLWTK
jgi:hypothetical protein